MEYIDHDEDFFINNFYVSLALIQESLDSMKRIPNSSPFIFSSYCDRIEDHAHLAQVHLYVEVVELLRTTFHSKRMGSIKPATLYPARSRARGPPP